MTSRKILVLSTYPIKNPQHGGQKRTSAIYEVYKNNFAEVKHCAVFFRGFYSDFDTSDIPLSRTSEKLVMQSPLTGDIVCGQAIFEDPEVKAKIVRLLSELQPDIIHVEQPFPYLGLKPLLAEIKQYPTIIYGSQNIEAPMKKEILDNSNADSSFTNAVVSQIEELEKDLVANSSLVAACTKEDMEVYKTMGAKHTALAPNGIAPAVYGQTDLDHWQKIFKQQHVDKFALFVGSAHPPNWTGFLDMVGKGLGFIKSNTRLVLAGSISDYFDREINPDNLDIEDATFWLRAYSAGRLSEKRLGALIKLCNVMLLPLTEGGGSNLKTAEAILANKKVVATHHALRSFEWFADFPNVWVADTKKDFQKCISEALSAKFTKRTSEQEKLAQTVVWDSCLVNMVKAVKDL